MLLKRSKTWRGIKYVNFANSSAEQINDELVSGMLKKCTSAIYLASGLHLNSCMDKCWLIILNTLYRKNITDKNRLIPEVEKKNTLNFKRLSLKLFRCLLHFQNAIYVHLNCLSFTQSHQIPINLIWEQSKTPNIFKKWLVSENYIKED